MDWELLGFPKLQNKCVVQEMESRHKFTDFGLMRDFRHQISQVARAIAAAENFKQVAAEGEILRGEDVVDFHVNRRGVREGWRQGRDFREVEKP